MPASGSVRVCGVAVQIVCIASGREGRGAQGSCDKRTFRGLSLSISDVPLALFLGRGWEKKLVLLVHRSGSLQ